MSGFDWRIYGASRFLRDEELTKRESVVRTPYWEELSRGGS